MNTKLMLSTLLIGISASSLSVAADPHPALNTVEERVREIELGILLKQYERLRTALVELRFNREMTRAEKQVLTEKEQQSMEAREDVLLRNIALLHEQMANIGKPQTSSDSPYRFSRSFDLSAEMMQDYPDGTALYKVSVALEFVNEGREPMEISAFILDSYVGELRASFSETNVAVLPLGFPPNRWNSGSAIEGAVNFKIAGVWSAVEAKADGHIAQPYGDIIAKTKPGTASLPTGLFKTGEKPFISDDYLVKARKGSYAGFVASVCFNRAARNEDLYSISREVHLPEKLGEKEHGF